MANLNDVVELEDGSVGVVGELLPSHADQEYRVFFDESYKDVTDDAISSTLSAPTYNVGDDVSLWPYAGQITAIDGDEFTLEIERQHKFDFGWTSWTGTYHAPRWRIIKDNDSRIERDWA